MLWTKNDNNNTKCKYLYTCIDIQYFPDVLFSGGNEVILQGSVLWLYCHVDVRALRVKWTKDGNPLVQDIPHIRKRISFTNSSITSLLVLDTVQASDNGVYQCTAEHGRTLRGRRLTLTGTFYGLEMVHIIYCFCAPIVSTPVSGLLYISSIDFNGPFNFTHRRASLFDGDTSSLQYTVKHNGSTTTTTVRWIKDGKSFTPSISSTYQVLIIIVK